MCHSLTLQPYCHCRLTLLKGYFLPKESDTIVKYFNNFEITRNAVTPTFEKDAIINFQVILSILK